MRERKPRVGTCEARLQRNGSRKEIGGSRVVGCGEPIHVLQTKMVSRPRIELLGQSETRIVGFVQWYLDLQCRYYLGDNFGAQFMNSIGIDLKALGPNDTAVPRIGKLNGD